MSRKKSIWDVFASVKLAIIIISLVAVTSIMGTFIPQNKPIQWYDQEYGTNLAQLLLKLDITNMYGSWWFLILLGLLSTNLLVCSLERFPSTWQQIKTDGLDTPITRLENMSNQQEWRSSLLLSPTVSALAAKLHLGGWNSSIRQGVGDTRLFAQKGRWSRIGVYLVHLSILVIFVGAIIGELFGFKGNVMIPETQQTDKIYTASGNQTIDLGFTVRCDSFNLEFYPTGMVKKYKSDLTIIQDGQELFQAAIEVNSPLHYQGITLYQASYEGYQDFMIKVTNKTSGHSNNSIVAYQEKGQWPQEGLTFGVVNAEGIGPAVSQLKIWFSDGKGAPSLFWLNNGATATIIKDSTEYLITGKQMYATGLQVSKDPGVWVVYSGCGLMLLGLVVAFFMSHQRVWIVAKEDDTGVAVLLAGSSHKNKEGFERIFNDLAEILRKSTLTQDIV